MRFQAFLWSACQEKTCRATQSYSCVRNSADNSHTHTSP